MPNEMERIGALFRKKREEMKLDLKECENSTSIRAGFLRAIEEGKIKEFISGVYAIGFIKQYAQFLEIEVESLVKEFPNALLSRGAKHDFSYGIGTLEMRGSLGGGVKWLPNLLWALGITSIIVLAYYFAKAIGAL